MLVRPTGSLGGVGYLSPYYLRQQVLKRRIPHSTLSNLLTRFVGLSRPFAALSFLCPFFRTTRLSRTQGVIVGDQWIQARGDLGNSRGSICDSSASTSCVLDGGTLPECMTMY